jgi:hypothetical protein
MCDATQNFVSEKFSGVRLWLTNLRAPQDMRRVRVSHYNWWNTDLNMQFSGYTAGIDGLTAGRPGIRFVSYPADLESYQISCGLQSV